MSDFFSSLLNSRAGNSLYSKLSNKAGEALGGLDQPWRGAASSLVNGIFPGFGGGQPDFSDNTYAAQLRRNLLNAEQEKFGRFGSDANGPSQFFDGIISSGFDQSQSGTAPQSTTSSQKKYDWRARLRPKNGGIERFYAPIINSRDENGNPTFSTEDVDYLMRPIRESNGLVWQYTPQILLNGGAEYNSHMGQGMNYPINTYTQGMPMTIPVTADFTANDIWEARYMLALLVFLRISIKSYFGDSAVANGFYGGPPPVMVFEYMGDHMFNKVPVTVQNYTAELNPNVDYIPVQVNDTVTYVPTRMNVMVTLQPHYTQQKQRRRYDVQAIANGAAYRDGFI